MRLLHILKESGLSPDSPALLQWLLDHPRWRTLALRFARLRHTPLILDRIRTMDAPLAQRTKLFTTAISLINAGNTYKTTGPDRTGLVDAAILQQVERFPVSRLMEVGASDGMASLHLLDSLPAETEVILTDRHPVFHRKHFGPLTFLLNGNRQLLGFKLLGIYCNLSLEYRPTLHNTQIIETLNPFLSQERALAVIRPFDMLSDRLDVRVGIIKCANLLNTEYFSQDTIVQSVDNLMHSLTPGGLLYISQNNARYRDGEAFFVLRNQGGTPVMIMDCHDHDAARFFHNR